VTRVILPCARHVSTRQLPFAAFAWSSRPIIPELMSDRLFRSPFLDSRDDVRNSLTRKPKPEAKEGTGTHSLFLFLFPATPPAPLCSFAPGFVFFARLFHPPSRPANRLRSDLLVVQLKALLTCVWDFNVVEGDAIPFTVEVQGLK